MSRHQYSGGKWTPDGSSYGAWGDRCNGCGLEFDEGDTCYPFGVPGAHLLCEGCAQERYDRVVLRIGPARIRIAP